MRNVSIITYFSLGFVHGKKLCNREEFCFHSVSHKDRIIIFFPPPNVFCFSFFVFSQEKKNNQGT